MTLGEYIKSKRLEKGLNMIELAKIANIKNWQNIQKWENNKTEPTATNILKLIDYLNLDIEELKKILYQD